MKYICVKCIKKSNDLPLLYQQSTQSLLCEILKCYARINLYTTSAKILSSLVFALLGNWNITNSNLSKVHYWTLKFNRSYILCEITLYKPPNALFFHLSRCASEHFISIMYVSTKLIWKLHWISNHQQLPIIVYVTQRISYHSLSYHKNLAVSFSLHLNSINQL